MVVSLLGSCWAPGHAQPWCRTFSNCLTRQESSQEARTVQHGKVWAWVVPLHQSDPCDDEGVDVVPSSSIHGSLSPHPQRLFPFFASTLKSSSLQGLGREHPLLCLPVVLSIFFHIPFSSSSSPTTSHSLLVVGEIFGRSITSHSLTLHLLSFPLSVCILVLYSFTTVLFLLCTSRPAELCRSCSSGPAAHSFSEHHIITSFLRDRQDADLCQVGCPRGPDLAVGSSDSTFRVSSSSSPILLLLFNIEHLGLIAILQGLGSNHPVGI